jgi:quinoprotein glucose dehydrogenase
MAFAEKSSYHQDFPVARLFYGFPIVANAGFIMNRLSSALACAGFFVLQLAVLDAAETAMPLEPAIAAASGEARSQIAGFKIHKGWKCEVAAAEPILANPVAFFVDPGGRIFVCESFRQNKGVTDNRNHDKQWLMADLAAQTVQDRIDYHRRLLGEDAKLYEQQLDRIRLLIDKDRDGIFEDSLVYFEGVHAIEDGTGAGVLARGRDVYYTCIPKLWKFSDTNDDGRSDESKVLYDGFGVRVAFRGHDMHGLTRGPDGRLYFTIGDRGYHVASENGTLSNPESGAVFRCELDGRGLEVFAEGLRNPQELAFDDFGNFFTCDNNSDSGDKARWTVITQGGDAGWRMTYQYIPDRGPFNREEIWHPFHEGSPAYIIPPIANFSDGPSGLAAYPGTGLSEEFRGAFFLCDFRGQASNSGIRSCKPVAKGAFFELQDKAEPIWNILATDVDFAADGSVLVSDWVNGWYGEGKGRIYRFFDPDQASSKVVLETKSLLESGFAQRTVEALVKLLDHADRRVRLEAQWEMAGRNSTQSLADVASNETASTLSRIHALWGLGQIARTGNDSSRAMESIATILQSADASTSIPTEVLVACLNAFSDSKTIGAPALPENEATKAAKSGVVDLVKHEEPRVRFAAAMAAGRLGLDAALSNIAEMLENNKDADPMIRHAGIMAMAGHSSPESIAALRSHASESVRLAAVVALRKRLSSHVSDFLVDPSEKVVLEAARAVNDVPALHSELSSLAKLIEMKTETKPILHRVLNSHFRLGSAENAAAIARFAADPSRPESMRLEALSMLETWDNPGVLDRIMNRYQPLPSRDAKPAGDGLDAVLGSILKEQGKILSKARTVAAKLGLQSVAPALTALVKDKNAPGKERADALESLLRLKSKELPSLVAEQIDDLSPSVRAKALQLLALFDEAAAIETAKKRVYAENVLERQSAWDLVAKIKSPAGDAIIDEGVVRYVEQRLPKDVWLNVKQASVGRLGAETQKRLDEFESSIAANATDNPAVAFRDCLEGGNKASGKILFFERSQLSCVRCHEIADKGGQVGPDLTGIGEKKPADYLLEAIVAPSVKLAEGFETIIIQTDEGEIINGIVKKRTDEELILTKPDGSIVKVPLDSIEGTKKGLSSMPADLMKYMDRRELRDLVAYLASLDGSEAKAKDAKKGKGHQN